MFNVADKILFNMDYLIWSLKQSLSMTTSSYCDLETINDENSFVARDGSLATMIRVKGNLKMIGGKDFQELVERISNNLKSYLSSGDHLIQNTFSSNPDYEQTHRLIRDALATAKSTMKRLELDLSDVYDKKEELLAKQYIRAEENLIILWTFPSSLTNVEKKHSQKERQKQLSDNPTGAFAQQLTEAAATVHDIHQSFVHALIQDLRDAGLVVEMLSSHNSLAAARILLDPNNTSDAWLPRLPGDALPLRTADVDLDGDLSNCLFPPIGEQIFPEGIDIQDSSIVKVNERYYGTLSMNLGPRDVEVFNSFFRKILNDKLPWLVSYRIVSDGYAQVEQKELLAILLSFERTSRMVKRSLDKIKEAMERGEVFLGLQIQFVTWVDGDNPKLLNERISRLTRAVQAWGGIETRRNDGNPASSLSASLPMMRNQSPANRSAAPVEDVVRMLPIIRPASPWSQGSVLFRTPDGKLFPYEQYSSLQAAWITLIYSPMGGGKSVLLNTLNTALVLAAGAERLPRIGILDIGPSSSGMISLVKEALPTERRHEALYVRMRNTRDYMVNPLDTLLGCRYPLSADKSFLSNFFTLLATPIGADNAYEAIPGIANMVIEEAYKAYSDQGVMPKRYDKGVDSEVDAQLQYYSFNGDEHTTWWEIVDYLFDQGDVHHAYLAQRFAVPTVGEVASFAKDSSVTSIYTGTVPGSTELITDYFWRAITEAIRMYEILGGPTRFSIGDARIVSLDLDEVAPSGGPTSDRQTAVMYMLGRHAITTDIYLRKDHLIDVPDKYRDYHRIRIEETENDPKRLCFDEFHRTRTAPAVRAQALLDVREGRKWKVEVVVASQLLNDFEEDMVDLATTVFILGAGNKSLNATVETFSLPQAAETALKNLGKPNKDGANLISWFDTNDGKFTHLLTNTLASEEIWAYSTSKEDVIVRDRLYEKLSPKIARSALAFSYPSGSIRKEYERRKALLKESGSVITEESDQNLLAEFVNEIYSSHISKVEHKA